MPQPLTAFLEKLQSSLQGGTFVKLTLSGYAGAEAELRNLYAREVELKEGRRLSLVWRYARRDVTKNLPFAEATRLLADLMEHGFRHAHLFTQTGDWQWREGKLKGSRPAFTSVPEREHNREKERTVDLAHAPYLQALGVTNDQGEVRPGSAGKLHQIQRFVHLLGHLAPEGRTARVRRVVDLGAGKGYLTFALAEFLRRDESAESEALGAAEIVGVERREDLVTSGNEIARRLGFENLRFVGASIDTYQPPGALDWVIALHACNTATDEAIHLGLSAGAELIVVAPCCHQEVRTQMEIPPVLQPMLQHGILLEHHAADLTDTLRALVLEIRGYKTSVFEFISTEHTGKNLMIAAQKRAIPLSPEPLQARLRELLAFYRLREQRLLRLTGLH